MLLWIYRRYRKLRTRRSLGILTVVTLVAVAILGNAVTFYVFDRQVKPDTTFEDAVWYSVISITTIGYGDLSASTLGARVGTVVFIVALGLGAFTLLIGMVIDWCTEMTLRGQRGLAEIMASDHILLVNFPGRARVRQVIEELRSDPRYSNREIVVVSDQVDELPFAYENLLFVNGSPLDAATFERARVADAVLAIVLATDYSDPASDAVVASAVSVMDRVKPDLHIVAECLHEEHRSLFESVRCDAVVPVLRIGCNLLVQAAADPGVTQLIDEITSNRHGDTLYSTVVGETEGTNYLDLVRRLIERDVNVLAIHRGDKCLTHFRDVTPRAGDRLIYVAPERQTWIELTRP